MRRSVCVFCGASPGPGPSFAEAARRFGRAMAEAGVGIVYGGAAVGMMGALSDGALEAGGEVVSVVPEILDWPEARRRDVTEVVVVPTLFERKREMFLRAAAFAALPGGIGTVDEVMEVLAWSQLGMGGLDGKPLLLMDLGGYFRPLRSMLDHAVGAGFARAGDAARLRLVPEPRFAEAVLDALRARSPSDGGARP